MRVSFPRLAGKSVRTSLALASVLSVPMFVSLAATAHAQAVDASPLDQLVTLELRDATLQDAVNALTGRAGLSNIVVSAVPGRSFQLVNVKLADQPLRKALNAIATSAGAILTETDGIFYLTPKSNSDNAQAVSTPAPVSTPSLEDSQRPRHSSRDTQLARIRLTYLLPSDFVKALDDPMYLALEADDTLFRKKLPGDNILNNLNRQMGTLQPFQPQSTSGNTNGSTPVQQGKNNAIPSSVGTQGRDDSSYSQGQFGGLQQPGGGGGGQLGGQQGGGQNGQPGGQGNRVPSLKPPGVQNIISNDSDNSLLVEYEDIDDLNRLREIVRLLDVAPKQVLIKAEFVNVTVSDADSFGISWQFSPAGNLSVQIPAQSASGTPSILMAYATGNAVANLLAEVTHDTSNILQAPMISTTNNRSANISVDSEVSVAQTIVIPVLNGTPITATEQVPIEATNGLTVLPHINGDNSISLALQPQLQTVTLRADGGYNSTNESLTTYRRVANGETMVLGGFINKTDSLNLQKVPILSDLPIIGNLFTQRDHSISGSEVLVFITPTIIEDHAQSLVGTGGGTP